jgi:hypothetical protein
MPIRHFLGDNRSFTPEDLDAMGKAFTVALAQLGLHDLKDPMTEIVARRIITAALAGERDPIRLTEIGAGARFTMREDVRATLLAMARRWNDLAEKAERNAHLRPPSDSSRRHTSAVPGMKTGRRLTYPPRATAGCVLPNGQTVKGLTCGTWWAMKWMCPRTPS